MAIKIPPASLYAMPKTIIARREEQAISHLTSTFLMWGGLALGGLLLYKLATKKKR